MTRKNLTLTLLTTLISLSGFTQQVVMLHSNGVATMYSGNDALADAYDAALAGDTLYVTGSYDLPNPFEKGLKVFGAGIHPDSTEVTQATLLSGELRIATGADGLHMEGIIFGGRIRKSYTHVVNNVSIVRCMVMDQVDLGYGGSPANSSSQYVFLQSVFKDLFNPDGIDNAVVSSCVFDNRIKELKGATVQNSSFLSDGYHGGFHVLVNCDNNTYLNNIFHAPIEDIDYGTSSVYAGYNNTFRNNVFISSDPLLGVNPVDVNNYKGVDLANVFVTVPGYTFEFTDDLHLQPSAQTTYSGTDNTPVGIYGGMFPMKEGFVPQNPHISAHQVSPTTDPNGNLQVNITVVAQPD